ncbi:MAG: hypothetical protein H7259_07455 [Cytophagales bacterium]|nr:hypothetical protein [Cytophaga sp.]
MVILRLFSLVTFLLLQVVFFEASAQQKRKGQYHRAGSSGKISLKNIKKRELLTLYANTGTATYFGELCDGLDCFTFRPQFGAGLSLRTEYLGKRLNLRLEARMFRLYSSDTYPNRNLDFRSTNWEVLALGEIDLFPYEKMMRRRPFVNPYIFGGIGLMTYDPWGQLPNGKWAQLRPLETEGTKYGNVALALPVGIGFKIRYSYKWNFMVEGGYRFTTTDHIDDASSKTYPDPSSFTNGIAAYMSNKSPLGAEQQRNGQRGNPKTNDGYIILSAGVTYTFSNNHKAKFKGKQHLLRKS